MEELKAIGLDARAINDRVAFPGSTWSNGLRTQFPPNPSTVPTADLTRHADVGAEYAAIGAAVKSVRLPSELTSPTEAGGE